ncbi:hypothetical protein BD413DRAFT_609829 [Trametes elegans]|nr:hypothetical protein BD413DRAFT_609829 [Trametes elegans]
MNLAQIIVAALVPGFNYITYFVSPLTSILISRFLLNLRQAARRSDANSSSTNDSDSVMISTHFPSIHMSTTMLDDLGLSLYSHTEDVYTEEAPPKEKMVYEDEPFLDGLDSDVETAGVETKKLI